MDDGKILRLAVELRGSRYTKAQAFAICEFIDYQIERLLDSKAETMRSVAEDHAEIVAAAHDGDGAA